MIETLYEIQILFLLLLAFAHIGILLGYRNRATPWHAKLTFAFGILVAAAWFYVRVWDFTAHSWIGVACMGFLNLTFLYYIIAYRRASFRDYQNEKENGPHQISS